MLLQRLLALIEVYRTSVKVLEMKWHEEIKCVDNFKKVLYFHLSLRFYRF